MKLVDHALHICMAEALLKGVKCKAAELRCNEIRPVLHDCLEPNMLLGALPAWCKVQHVLAFCGLSIVLALGARKLHAKRFEDGFLLFEALFQVTLSFSR